MKGKDIDSTVISLRIPKSLIEKLDILTEKLGFTRRAELIRQAIREFIEKHKELLEE